MLSIFQGHRPDVTPAQVLAGLIAGVPVISNLLAAFGVFSPSPQQQHALFEALNWAVPFAGVLIGGDAALRAARNHADARVQASAIGSSQLPHDLAPAPDAEAGEDELSLLSDAELESEGLPSDAEEFAAAAVNGAPTTRIRPIAPGGWTP